MNFGNLFAYFCQRNTLQAVLVTNGVQSVAIFNYNKISWTSASSAGGDDWGLGGSPAQVYCLSDKYGGSPLLFT